MEDLVFLESKIQELKEYFVRLDGIIIAYSGGVDSSLLAYIAHSALKNNMMAAIADSPSLSRREFQAALAFADNHGIPLKTVITDEHKNAQYQANQGDRCYFCKKTLFQRLFELRDQLTHSLSENPWSIAYGVNMDDLGDHRPGMIAADEANILAPYVELEIDKATIRSISQHLHLDTADKPAMPCLASRIAYGEEVTPEKLLQVEQAENIMRDLEFEIFRVRHHGTIARIEVLPADQERLLKSREKINQQFRELGFVYIVMDLDGFSSGSLNRLLD